MRGKRRRVYLLDRRPVRKIFLLLLLGAIAGAALINLGAEDIVPAPCGCSSGADAADCIRLTEAEHPYGTPVGGSLAWEEDETFLRAFAAYGLQLRLAAFRIDLPDPPPGEAANVALAADRLAGISVLPGDVFSMNRSLGPYTVQQGYQMGSSYQGNRVVRTAGGGVCKVASALFNAVILADLPVVERHTHGMLVPYVPPAQDAAVVYGSKDFRFRNDTAAPVLIWADTVGSTLFLALYGTELSPGVAWHHDIVSRQEQPTYYYRNRDLDPGESRVVSPGANGLTVKSWLTVERPDGALATKDMGVSRYRPMPRIIERN